MPMKPQVDLSRQPVSRRRFAALTAAVTASVLWPGEAEAQGATGVHFNVAEWDRARIVAAADLALKQPPAPLTSLLPSPAKLDPHLFYSEAADWWPDEAKPGKFVERDGAVNVDAFLTHVNALVHLNEQVGALTAAWRLTQQQAYADHALALLRSWFLEKATAMAPTLDHAGSVGGEGRPEGVADAMPLAELMRAAAFLYAGEHAQAQEAEALRGWCGALLQWMNESRLGGLARDRTDLYAICWTAIAAELARFTRNDTVQRECTHRFRDKLLRQMNFDGAFPQALTRRRPFGMSLFTLECLSLACESLSTPFDNLWRYTLPDGRGMHSAIAFHLPSMADRNRWPYTADTQHFTELPVRGGALLFAGRSLDRPEYIEVWKRLRADPISAEIARETPVRQPSLWTVRPPA